MTDPDLPRIAPVQAPGGTYAKMIGRVRRRRRQRIGLVVLTVLGLGVFAAMLAATDRTSRPASTEAASVGPASIASAEASITCTRGGLVVDVAGNPLPGVQLLVAGGDSPALTRTAADGTWSWTGSPAVALVASPSAITPGLAAATVGTGCTQDVTTVLQPGATR